MSAVGVLNDDSVSWMQFSAPLIDELICVEFGVWRLLFFLNFLAPHEEYCALSPQVSFVRFFVSMGTFLWMDWRFWGAGLAEA